MPPGGITRRAYRTLHVGVLLVCLCATILASEPPGVAPDPHGLTEVRLTARRLAARAGTAADSDDRKQARRALRDVHQGYLDILLDSAADKDPEVRVRSSETLRRSIYQTRFRQTNNTPT